VVLLVYMRVADVVKYAHHLLTNCGGIAQQEGSSWNKAIEFYNPTTASIALDAYFVGRTHNGGMMIEDSFNFTTGATIASGATFTVCQTRINETYFPQCNQMSPEVLHNGDDVVMLVRRSDNVTIDTFGTFGPDPGTSWTVCGNSTATRDTTLVRKPVVFRGNPNWSEQIGSSSVDCEWLIRPLNDFANGGMHTCVLPAAPSNSASASSDSASSSTMLIIGVTIAVLVGGVIVAVVVHKMKAGKTNAMKTIELMDTSSELGRARDNPIYDAGDVLGDDRVEAEAGGGYMEIEIADDNF
jgi:predicted extracellular nuclease